MNTTEQSNIETQVSLEPIQRRGSFDAVYSALCTRVRNVRLDLVETFGLELVMREVEEMASSYECTQLEEIGTSDVSCWIATIEESLKRRATT